jgi:hypothetical protein
MQKYKINVTLPSKKAIVYDSKSGGLYFLRNRRWFLNRFLQLSDGHILRIPKIICNFAHV